MCAANKTCEKGHNVGNITWSFAQALHSVRFAHHLPRSRHCHFEHAPKSSQPVQQQFESNCNTCIRLDQYCTGRRSHHIYVCALNLGQDVGRPRPAEQCQL